MTLPAPGGSKQEPLFEGGFGESFKYGGGGLPQNLNPGILQNRVTQTTATANQQGAKVVLDKDQKRGGFTVQTAYPQVPTTPVRPETTSDVQGTYEGPAIKEKKTNKHGVVTQTTQNVQKGVSLAPVTGQSNVEEQTKERMARIQASGKKHRWDPVAKKVVEEDF